MSETAPEIPVFAFARSLHRSRGQEAFQISPSYAGSE
ncbi:hypothetical protein SAMN05720354_11081 [Nitrosospira sp. Nsp1]|nr:hypothetical protein SAMN05720354_11081 [Nitrosospira sp. Nsp1]